MMACNSIRWLLAAGAAAAIAFATPSGSTGRPAPDSVRLYVFDCGTLHVADMGRFQLKKEEVSTTDLSVACYLVVHPKGTLMWDTGAVLDSAWKPTGSPVAQHIVLPDGEQRDVTVRRSLESQLSEVGYAPADITYIALSHYHYDHTANANAFAGATWLVRQIERDAMFVPNPAGAAQPSTYSALRNSKTVLLGTEDYDVFKDGTAVIKFAPGHTPGHQVLYVKLQKTGGVLLSGDLYHFPEERALGRVPTFEFNQDQTRASRAVIEAFLKQTGAQLWIQHDFAGNAKLKKSPAFYD
ncbi:MAG TPA: N-acyl homoserine lactonase family protein [Candidatus Acidoferrales bacterium]